jgi:acyl dehydratase
MDEVRFRAPVFLGDTIHPIMEVLTKEDRAPGGVVVLDEQILNQRDEVVIAANIRVWVGAAPS